MPFAEIFTQHAKRLDCMVLLDYLLYGCVGLVLPQWTAIILAISQGEKTLFTLIPSLLMACCMTTKYVWEQGYFQYYTQNLFIIR